MPIIWVEIPDFQEISLWNSDPIEVRLVQILHAFGGCFGQNETLRRRWLQVLMSKQFGGLEIRSRHQNLAERAYTTAKEIKPDAKGIKQALKKITERSEDSNSINPRNRGYSTNQSW